MTTNKVLVTGGSGFIGTNLVEYLVNKGNLVLNVDIAKPKNKRHLEYWVNCDINDCSKLQNVVNSFDPTYVVHLAARTDLNGRSIDDYKTNTVGVQNVLSSIENSKSLKKIIITSSMLVCRPGYQPVDDFDYSPSTIYGRSKIITEKLVWSARLNCDWLIIRPTSIWGPWFGVPYIDYFYRILRNSYFHIGYKSITKTYGFVGNSVRQIIDLLMHDTQLSESRVFYIGDNPATNIDEWSNEIANEVGLKIKRLPYFFFVLVALVGDVLGFLGVNFPLTSFRLKNMSTMNVIDLSKTMEIVTKQKYSRLEGVRITLEWMNETLKGSQ